MRKSILSLFALATLAAASPFELSSPGGSFTAGSGPTFSQFTLSPFDITLDPWGTTTTHILNEGTVTLPAGPYLFPNDSGIIAGQLSLTFGAGTGEDVLDKSGPLHLPPITVSNDVYSLFVSIAPPGTLKGGEQMTGIVLTNVSFIEFRFIPVIGAPLSTAPLDLDIHMVYLIPEPSTFWLLLSTPAIALFKRAGRSRKR